MKGVIEIENMEFFSYHGCFKEENIIGNTFLVTMRIETDMQVPAQTDNINDAVNYQLVYNLVKEQVLIPSNLLENVAFRILESVYDKMSGILSASVKVSKINPPMGGKIEKVSVTLSR